jgi:hypothetical protein
MFLWIVLQAGFATDFLAKNFSPKTISNYRDSIYDTGKVLGKLAGQD